MIRKSGPGRSPEKKTRLQAGCKVNLYLRIAGRRTDSMHELESLFLPLARPRDRLVITPAEEGTGLTLSCSQPKLETEENILHATYKLFAERTGFRPDLRVYLEKNIPFGSGLGGGSSDAAAFLKYLNELQEEQRKLSPLELQGLAGTIGSDVPFFLYNRPALVRGAGEKIEFRAVDLSPFLLLLVCPDIRIATREAYKKWDRRVGDLDSKGQKDLTVTANRFTSEFCFTGFLLYNDFEQVVFADIPELRSLKETLLNTGAEAAVLSGSGASLISLFRSQRCLSKACSWLTDNQISYFVTRTGV